MIQSVPSTAADYLCSDGRSVAESDLHLGCMAGVRDALRRHFEKRARGEVYVGANLLVYCEQGNREAVVAPDVFVVLGVPAHRRGSFLLWNEPKGPDFVLEVTSKSMREEDGGRKRGVYAALGVEEYSLYDPRGEYLAPPLQGYRLRGSGYRSLPAVAVLPDGATSVRREVLGLDPRDLSEAQVLRLHDPATGQDLLTHREADLALEEESAARRAAEARTAELEARLRDFESALASSRGAPPRKPVRQDKGPE